MAAAQTTRTLQTVRPLPAAPGVGYKSQHFHDILAQPGSVEWLEIHAENYMGDGGRPLAQLRKLREIFPISCHGVGLSIGGEGPLDQDHLQSLKYLTEWLEPASFSEHLAWSTHDGHYFADLLPLPYTAKTLTRVSEHIHQVQEALGRTILIENPSNYLEFDETTMGEIEFLTELAQCTGCGLLLDVNNVYVSCINRGWDYQAYILRFPHHLVGEIHLGGHEEDPNGGAEPLLIDNHASEVTDPVWQLFELAVNQAGPLPTLIEWDNDVPSWSVLAAEADQAKSILGRVNTKAA